MIEPTPSTTGHEVAARCQVLAYAAHLYTASGLICGILAAAAIMDGQYQYAFLWLLIAILVDATDGYVARRARVEQVLPHIDGRKLDDIVDYLNYTFLPLLMIWRAGWLPEPGWMWVSVPLVASLLAFSNTRAKQGDDGFFVGFPSYWNIFAFYTALCFRHYGAYLVLGLTLLLSLLSVVPVRFVYLNHAPRWRGLFMGGGILWLGVIIVMLARFPDVPLWLSWVSFSYPALYMVLSVYLDFSARAGPRVAN